MLWDFSILFHIASITLALGGSWHHILKIPDINVFSGQEFDVKLNFSGKRNQPEEASLIKFDDSSSEQNIKNIFHHYHKDYGSMTGSIEDSRISFIGNLSSGRVWFRFLDVRINDSGTYGILYKKPLNSEIFQTVFEVNVTQAPTTIALTSTSKEKNEDDHYSSGERETSTPKVESRTGAISTFVDASGALMLVLAVTINVFI